MKTLILSLACSFLSLVSICAQPLCEVKQYTFEDGLTHSMVNSIIQDSHGLMWLATWNGLTKFDGYDFKYYKSYPGDGCTMRNTRILKISETKKGNIWCHTQDHRAYLFDVRSERFMDVLQPIEEKSGQTYPVDQIFTLKKGITWITSRKSKCFRIDDTRYPTDKNVVEYGTFDKSLKGDVIYQIFQDTQNDEWLLTDKGVTIFGKKRLNSNYPFHMFIEKDRQIWLASQTGSLALYDSQKSTVQFVEMPNSVNQIYCMKSLQGPYLGFGTNAGFVIYQTKKGEANLIRIPGNTGVRFFREDKRGDLWFFDSMSGILHLDRATGRVERLQAPANMRIDGDMDNMEIVLEDCQGYVWVVPKNGSFCYYDRKQNKLKYYLSNPEDPTSIVSPSIRPYYQDNQGNLWFGTNSTFGKIAFFNRNFRLRNDENRPVECRALFNDRNNNLWMASKDGKLRLYDAEERLLGFFSRNGKLQKSDCTFGANVYCIQQDHAGNIWLGTKKSGLFVFERTGENGYDFKVRQFTNEPGTKYSISSNSIYSIFEDSRQHLWIGTHGNGLNLLERGKDGSVRFLHSSNDITSYPVSHGSSIRHIIEVAGALLIGTTDGLITFSTAFDSPQNIRFYWNTRRASDKSSLSNNDVMYLYAGRNNRVYLATQSGGMNEVLSKNLLSDALTFKIINEQSGLASDLTRSLLEDKSGALWIVSKNALTRFNPQNGSFENFDSFTFKPPVQFSEATISSNAKGRIYIGTDRGFLSYDPMRLYKDHFVPGILFTEFIADFNQAIHVDNTANPSIQLTASQRNITIQFAAIDYRDTRKIRYKYFLKGIDKEWHDAKHNRSASYNNLPHGNFRFLVKSTNSDGYWVNNEKGLDIHIAPTFWETGWAWVFYCMVLAALILLVVYILFTFYRLKHEVDLEQQLSEIKLRFFTDVSHELRTPLTLISSPISEILENESLTPTGKEHLRIVQNNTNRMLRLVNQILDFRKIQNNKMNVLIEEVDVVAFLSRIMDNFQLLVQEKKIAFQLESAVEQYNLWIDKDKFEKIFFNLLSNAFKYTPSGKSITVKFHVEGNQAILIVKDEGIGIHESKMGLLFQRFETLTNMSFIQSSTGLGLSLAKELVELHHGSIEVQSQPTLGSEFKVTLKTGYDHFKEDTNVEFLLSNSMTDSTTSDSTKEDMVESNNGEKKTILIVEDNAELSRFLRNILLPEYDVLEARNGEEGLQLAIRSFPDMIVSDIMMPKMDGLDMVHAIKESQDICHIPIILLSAKDSLDDRINALERGIDDYITKPFSATFFKKRIRILLKQRRQVQEAIMESLTSNRIDLMPSEPQITSYDENLIKKIIDFLESNYNNAELTVDDFVKELNISRTILYRKMKTLLGLSPVDLISDFRLKRSIQYLDSGLYSISEIAYMCGFNDPNYFAKVFKRKMGITPKAYKPKKK